MVNVTMTVNGEHVSREVEPRLLGHEGPERQFEGAVRVRVERAEGQAGGPA